ncbi:MAG TPA: isocitrate/isopropylmalate family dehydrogenase [Geobacterales bacterium]|nr:isocitrate/isopropylmalate family dehydrogenase [Geobacterales bacterium]
MDVMVIMGDGIGPEVMKAALRILDVLNDNYSAEINPVIYDINSETLISKKWTLDKIIEEAKRFKVILKAPLGNPKIRSAEGTELALDIVLGLRFGLDLYANIRPIRLLPSVISPLRYFGPGSIDYVIVRENSEGLYASHFGGLILRDELAIDVQTITRKGTERIAEIAFELARSRKGAPSDGIKKVLCIDKSNVLKSFAFFRKIFSEVAKRYSDVEAEFMYADAAAQYMILHPDRLDVIVTENMFGDLLSDLAAATVGGLGLAYSANVSKEAGMFEPVHGSAIDIAGKNIANPVAMLLSLSMMLSWLNMKNLAELVEGAVIKALESGHATPDLGGKDTTTSFTEFVISNLLNN